jgi:DNA-binding IclR family transcriptional regulator
MNFEANQPVKTTQKTFEIIEHLSRTDQIRLSEIADQLDISKGIVHNHLSTLRELGYVQKIGEEYQLTPKLLTTGFQSRSNSRLFNAAHVPLSDTADSISTGIILSEQAVSESIVTDVRSLPETLDISIGTTFPLRESLIGLVVAAAGSQDLPDDIAAEYNKTELIESISEEGYVIGPITPAISIGSVAVPIVDEQEYCYGSVAVLLPTDSSDQQQQQIIEAAVQLRTRIENRVDSGWESTRSFATEKHSWIS